MSSVYVKIRKYLWEIQAGRSALYGSCAAREESFAQKISALLLHLIFISQCFRRENSKAKNSAIIPTSQLAKILRNCELWEIPNFPVGRRNCEIKRIIKNFLHSYVPNFKLTQIREVKVKRVISKGRHGLLLQSHPELPSEFLLGSGYL